MKTNTNVETGLVPYEIGADRAMKMGKFSMLYAQVERMPRYENGRRENDAEHSLMLGKVDVQLAHEYYPSLDFGLLMQFSAVHDYPEIYTGDIPTLGISDSDRAVKEANEAIATERLLTELPEPWRGLLKRYERQEEPEARFTRLVDKILPAIVYYYGDGARVFREDYGVHCRQQLDMLAPGGAERLRNLFPEFPHIHEIRDIVVERKKQKVFDD